ncbi:hypothetical protein CEY16_01780 [Halalkalibacillus sediminis]|uniref:YugN-like family protein n=1 Tax=Halalkalibacillus sediminis TaxID=2018042 RepID=A0A2I0QWN2_9BACI|nr:YugN family protein [Halalkalibacillus sediminis]PKR78510.1 hypothetical protein CEY16_01780 [Halalkalibacillus sediminis]
MRMENNEIEGIVIAQEPLTYTMNKNGFVLGGQWDYERVTYDYKINSPEKNITYYIRVNGLAVDGDVDKGGAIVKLMAPLLGKHYYPHGVEYGEGETFPDHVLDKAEKKLSTIAEELKSFQEEVNK